MGDPAGIGPEIIVKAWNALRQSGPAFMVVGDAASLAAASAAGHSIIRRVPDAKEAMAIFPTALPVLDMPIKGAVVSGKPTPVTAPAIVAWIETAVGLALSGRARGIVTAPIAKAPLYEAGFSFPGHTEFLGELTASSRYEGERGPVMLLGAGDLKVTLVTIHEPLAKVPQLVTEARIITTARITHEALRRDFGVAHPRLAIAGLNPHAGEGGALGDEEIRVIEPAVRALQAEGIDARGPLPPDTMFHAEARSRYDAAVCMYHDQALIPVKMLDFWGGVNITLGLPIVRTSPDHGTGFDIAGRGVARPESLIAAIRAANEIAQRRRAA